MAVADLTGEQRERDILKELERIQVREEAQRRHAALTADEKSEPYSTPLEELLAEPDDDPQYLIEGLWPTGGNVLFSAQYKAGKTTVVGNLVRCLADGDTFLGSPNTEKDIYLDRCFTVRQLKPDEGIFIADLELDRRTLRRWLRDQNIKNPAWVRAESFRGRLDDFDILNPARRDEWARALRSWAIKILVVDPVGPLIAAYGFSEESNTDVAKVLGAIDALAAEADVEEVLLVHHMGHSGERSRGASVFRTWPDAEWRLLREEPPRGKEASPDAARFFTAEGRDVAVYETKLDYDPTTRHLSIAGGTRSQYAANKHGPAVLQAVTDNPGLSGRALEDVWGDIPQTAGRKALKALVKAGEVHTVSGPRKALHHVRSDGCGAPTACLLAKKEGGLDE
jgi:RecA-family ATPase